MGHPLLAYSIAAARESGVIDRIVVSTDDDATAEIALAYGADVPGLRPREASEDSAHDYAWVSHAVEHWIPQYPNQALAILRPTSPLRSGGSIARALHLLRDSTWADSVRAMRPVTEHPGKMWRISPGGEATTYLPQDGAYNGPTQALETLWVQASSLEIVWRASLEKHRSIAGDRVLGFELPGEESHDINTERDWTVMEALLADQPELLPRIER